MFVYTIRSSSVKFFGIIALTLTLLIAMILSGGTVFASASADGSVMLSGMTDTAARVSFLSSQGLSVKEGSEVSEELVLPEDFDRVLVGYNQLQKMQGFDITKYARKRVTRYTYTLSEYGDYEGEVNANLIIYRNRIIAADVSSATPGGFVEPIIK